MVQNNERKTKKGKELYEKIKTKYKKVKKQ